jgi:acetyltransferase-like isoleucine patch superfamily enzyme
MPNIVEAVFEKLRLFLLRRCQHDSVELRRLFRNRFDIDVGLYSYGCFDQWRMPGPIRVGRYCSIANTVRSAPINHLTTALTTHPVLYERKFGVVEKDIEWLDALIIEDDVWIGHNAVLLPGCKFVGRGAVVGAGAIVTKAVEPYTIVAGNPARVLRKRFSDDVILEIEKSRWWELDPSHLKHLVVTRPKLLFEPTQADLLIWNEEMAR